MAHLSNQVMFSMRLLARISLDNREMVTKMVTKMGFIQETGGLMGFSYEEF